MATWFFDNAVAVAVSRCAIVRGLRGFAARSSAPRTVRSSLWSVGTVAMRMAAVCRLCRQGFVGFAAQCLGRNDLAPRRHGGTTLARQLRNESLLTWAPRVLRVRDTASSGVRLPPHGCDCGGHDYGLVPAPLHSLLRHLGCDFAASSVVEHDFRVFVVGNFSFPFRPLSLRVISLCTFFSVAVAQLHLGSAAFARTRQ